MRDLIRIKQHNIRLFLTCFAMNVRLKLFELGSHLFFLIWLSLSEMMYDC